MQKARGYVKRYPRLSKKTSEGIKAAQTKQRALAVAKVIAQVGEFFSSFFSFFFRGGSFVSVVAADACDCYTLVYRDI